MSSPWYRESPLTTGGPQDRRWDVLVWLMQQQDPARLMGELHIQFGLGRGDEPSLRVWEMEMRRSKSQPMVKQLNYRYENWNQKSQGKWRTTALSKWKHWRIRWKSSKGLIKDLNWYWRSQHRWGLPPWSISIGWGYTRASWTMVSQLAMLSRNVVLDKSRRRPIGLSNGLYIL